MYKLLRRAVVLACALSIGATLGLAQDWKTADTLPNVDLGKLSAAQKATALRLLRSKDCSCGCGMKLAECRIADPSCSYSTGLAAAIVDAIRQGKSESDAIAAADNSKWANVQPQKLLEDPVKIPTAAAPFTGPANAPITIVEFSDFQCPYCAAAVPEIEALLKNYPKQVKLIFKQFPLEIHPQADLAADAAVAANKQGKFWQMHDALFANHDDLSRKNIFAIAQKQGLDMTRFESDLGSTDVRETVIRDVQDGDKAGVEGTPTIFLNGQRYNGPIVLSALKPILEDALKQPAPQAAAALR